MLKSFHKHITQNLPFLSKSKLLIAISGGLDSVVLTHLCHQAKLNFALAHCNFNLRGKESDADQNFVLQLAKELEVKIFMQSFSTEAIAKENKVSTQMAARDLRYNWFQELSDQLQFDYILTAHHADDNLETFLINLTRGTGIDGLTGIPEVNQNIVRPLLKFTREEIENFAKSNNYKWQEDSSNASTKYLRNKLRHDVIPVLKEINPELLSNFEKTQKYLQQTNSLAKSNLNKISSEIILQKLEDKIIFNVVKLKSLKHKEIVLYSIFNVYGFTAWKDILKLLNAQSGKYIYSNNYRLLKDRNTLILTKLNSYKDLTFTITEILKDIVLPIGTLSFEHVKQLNEINNFTAYLDKDLLKFPLTVNIWQKGDYFYPLGMQGKKKLSKFFKDEKYSLLEKEKALILYSAKDVVWVINKRGDNRYKVTEKTKNILKITLQ